MKKTNITKKPLEIKRLSKFYIAFRLKKWFITDNRNLFLVPIGGFCPNCFQRRYFSEVDCKKVEHISESALALANNIDGSYETSSSWAWFSIEHQRKNKSFQLISYEDCSRCKKECICNKIDAENKYEKLLGKATLPKIEELKKLLFSFGFAKSLSTKNKLGFAEEEYEKLLGGNFFSHVFYRIPAADGSLVDATCLGYSKNRALAETKSMMEYIERYAFIQQSRPMQANESDDKIISDILSLYSKSITEEELGYIRSEAIWAINLATKNVHPVPLRFIYDKGDLDFIRPCSSGFAAHVDFKSSLIGSILELVERDAFIRFWHDPLRAYHFLPNEDAKKEINDILSVLKIILENEYLVSKCFVIRSPTMLPVVMSTISSSAYDKAPSLIFGYGVDCNLQQALLKSLNELRTNACNLLFFVFSDKNYLSKIFESSIESIPDRMNFYSTKSPRPKLGFLDMENPLTDGIFEPIEEKLDNIVARFTEHNLEIFGIDVTPECFIDKDVFVTRAFSPNLYPLQYHAERSLNLSTNNLSVKDELPHFFI